jgi:hypothetical protein
VEEGGIGDCPRTKGVSAIAGNVSSEPPGAVGFIGPICMLDGWGESYVLCNRDCKPSSSNQRMLDVSPGSRRMERKLALGQPLSTFGNGEAKVGSWSDQC